MKYNGAEIVIKLLENQGIKYIAGIPGGFNLPLYDALYQSNITHILARHEQGAGFIAQGMSRTSDKVGVCFATSGPGVTNLLTAIADAKLDSIPLVAITGQVPLSAIGTDAFQEVDAYGLTIPITKHNFLIRSIDELFKIIPEAFKIALEGRPGPVLIDIPKNIQTEIIDIDDFPSNNNSFIVKKSIDISTLKSIADLINISKKPILYAGGGILGSSASDDLYNLAKKSNIPVTLSLMGLSAFPSTDRLNIGMLGMHGAPYTNYLMNEADLIIALGIRFDDRATGKVEAFCPNAKIIHIDIDPSEINKVKPATISMVANVRDVLKGLLPLISTVNREEWLSEVNEFKSKYPLPTYSNPMHPANIIPFVASKVPNDTIIATDVGEHQMWTAQRYPFQTPRSFLTSGGLGTMGFGLPVAIGAAFANPDKLVISFSGDGSILMNIQELATLSEFGLNVKIIILNNHHLGLVRQQQELFYNKHYIASCFIGNPDFKTIARGFGLNSYDLADEKDPFKTLEEILSIPGPCLINIQIEDLEKVLPMVAPGAANTKMIGEVCND